tara:strand:- start:2502 stop:3518 length:1017 start_codon:yes stop_codon:yes gene_type:complete
MSIRSYNSILITGGTGSFGQEFLKEILTNYKNFKRIVVFSRDELKQWNMRLKYPENKFPQIRFFIGDVRDKERLKRAFENIEVVVHAAALKQVPAAEYNPIEFIRTNVMGADNIIQAALDSNIKKLIALSTDKAAGPINLYGATKLCSDKLFIAANNYKGSRELSFSVVRYGNVLGSRGSVIPLFLQTAKKGFVNITHEDMTRFSISLSDGVKRVCNAIDIAEGGEIFIPKIPSYRIMDVANAIGPSVRKNIVGLRPGEKIHEDMILTSDSLNTFENKNNYVIIYPDETIKNEFIKKNSLVKVSENFSYCSNTNNDFLDVSQIRELIIKNLKKDFVPV